LVLPFDLSFCCSIIAFFFASEKYYTEGFVVILCDFFRSNFVLFLAMRQIEASEHLVDGLYWRLLQACMSTHNHPFLNLIWSFGIVVFDLSGER